MDPEPKNLNGPVEPSWTQNACACGPMDQIQHWTHGPRDGPFGPRDNVLAIEYLQ